MFYIGRIILSEKDSKSWSGQPEVMYVVRSGSRTNKSNAELFEDKTQCIARLKSDYERYGHNDYHSKMQVLEVNAEVINTDVIS